MTIILVTTNNDNAEKLEAKPYYLEKDIEAHVYQYPEIIPLEEIKEGTKLFVAVRQFKTINNEPIDALGFDQEGNIYVIETKLDKNTSKRQVLAQMLDYGAALWLEDDPEGIISRLNKRINDDSKMQFSSFEDAYQRFFDLDYSLDFSASDSIDDIKRNLKDGKIRYVLLMDKVDDKLKGL